MPVALSQIKDLLFPGLYGVDGKYPTIERQWPMWMKRIPSNMALERRAAVRFLSYAQIKNEGGPSATDNNMGQRYIYNAQAFEVALMYAITRPAIDDNLYKAEFGPNNDGLLHSFKETEEVYAANVLNNGTTYNSAIGGDGVSLFNTAHPIDGGTIGNQPSPDVSLNETSLLNAGIAIRSNWKDYAGLKMHARGEKLIVPPNLEPIASRLFRSELRVGTGNNDINAVREMEQSFKGGYMVYDYLTSSFAWFVLTNIPGFVFFERKPYETDMSVEFSTDNLLVKGYQRYIPTYYEWRAAYGTFPTS